MQTTNRTELTSEVKKAAELLTNSIIDSIKQQGADTTKLDAELKDFARAIIGQVEKTTSEKSIRAEAELGRRNAVQN